MRVGCYTLHLYCTAYGAQPNHTTGESSTCGWAKNIGEFTGRTETECLRTARAEGWCIARDQELCPGHYGIVKTYGQRAVVREGGRAS